MGAIGRIIPIPLGPGNAYLVIDRKAMIVDSGYLHNDQKIMQEISKAGLKTKDIRPFYARAYSFRSL